MAAVFHTRNDILVRTRNGRDVVIEEPILVARDDGAMFRVPVGATSDGASVPAAFWQTLPPFGEYWPAAVVHDAGYRGTLERQLTDGTWAKAMLPRAQCDLLFLDLMMALGVPEPARTAIYEAVRFMGFKAFHGDTQPTDQA